MSIKNSPARQSPQDHLMESFKKDLDHITPYINALVPYKGGVEKFRQMTLLALIRSPGLLQADRKSLLLAILWCSQKDLEPGVEDGAWLIPFKGKVVPIPAYKGLIKKAIETGSALDVDPQAVYESDDFGYTLGLEPNIHHIPPRLGDDRGALVGAYAVITLPNGDKKFRVLDRPSIEKIRNAGAAWKAAPNSGPWHDWEEAMYLKTVIKQGLKTVPVKPAYRDLLYDDGRIEAGISVAALMHEAGVELPKELEGFDTSSLPAAPEPEVDLSKYNKLLAEKKLDASRLALVELRIKELATHYKKTVPWVKQEAAQRFDGFWGAFEEWEAKQTPTTELEPDTKALEVPGGPTGLTASETVFQAQADALWDEISEKKIPLAELSGKTGVGDRKDIAPESYEAVKWFVQTYGKPVGKGKK